MGQNLSPKVKETVLHGSSDKSYMQLLQQYQAKLDEVTGKLAETNAQIIQMTTRIEAYTGQTSRSNPGAVHQKFEDTLGPLLEKTQQLKAQATQGQSIADKVDKSSQTAPTKRF